LPSTTGNVQTLYSSMSDARCSVWMRLPLPMICRSRPGCFFNAPIAAAASPCSRLELFHFTDFNVREATCFLAAFSDLAVGSPAGW